MNCWAWAVLGTPDTVFISELWVCSIRHLLGEKSAVGLGGTLTFSALAVTGIG